MSEEKSCVFERIRQVMKKVGIVSKSGKVNIGSRHYDYASDYDILVKVNPAMVEVGLIMYPLKFEFIPCSSDLSGLETIMMTYRVVCTDNPDSYLDIVSIGQGVDRQDKAFAKAQTMCLKYALRQLLLIPTGDDPDNIKEDPDNIKEDPDREIKKLVLKSSYNDNKTIKAIGGARMEWDRSGPGKDTFLHWWVEDTADNRDKFKAFIPTKETMIPRMRKWAEEKHHGFDTMIQFCIELSKSKTSPLTWTDDAISDFIVKMDVGGKIMDTYNKWYGQKYAKEESDSSDVPF